jgi:hypothetical protein
MFMSRPSKILDVVTTEFRCSQKGEYYCCGVRQDLNCGKGGCRGVEFLSLADW